MTLELVLSILLAGFLSNNYALLHFLGTGAVIENEPTPIKNDFLIERSFSITAPVPKKCNNA